MVHFALLSAEVHSLDRFVRTSKDILQGYTRATRGAWRQYRWPKKPGRFSSTSSACWPGWKSSLAEGSVLSGCGWRWRRTESSIGCTRFLWSPWEEHLGEKQDWSCGSHQGCTWGGKVTKISIYLETWHQKLYHSPLLCCISSVVASFLCPRPDTGPGVDAWHAWMNMDREHIERQIGLAYGVRSPFDGKIWAEGVCRVAHWHPEGAGGNIAHKLAVGKVVHCRVTHHLKCHRVCIVE